MRQLTFLGFVTVYLAELSLGSVGGIRSWAVEAAQLNPRMREPLVIYAILHGKQQLLLSCLLSAGLSCDWAEPARQYTAGNLEELIADGALPYSYQKVYKAFQYRRNGVQNDNHTKALIHHRIVSLQHQKQISNYKIYTALGLNHGNMNSYLKHCDCSKVSLDTARQALQYLEQMQ